MARTKILNYATLAYDSAVAQGTANNADATNGNYIECLNSSTFAREQSPGKLLLVAVVGTTATTLTVRAAGNGVNVAGVAQTSPYPSNTVFTQGSRGDQVFVLTVSATTVIGPLTTDWITQPDGNIYLDWSNATGVTFFVYQLPYNAL